MTELPAKGAAFRTLIGSHAFIALDIETTTRKGTATSPDEYVTYPISVGAVVYLNDSLGETFHELGNPGVPVHPKDSAYNGITTEDLEAAEVGDVRAMLTKLDMFLAAHPDLPLVCHHGWFDITNLAAAYDRATMPMFDRLVYDTQFIGPKLKVHGIPARVALTKLCTRYGVASTVADVPAKERRKYKGLKDAMDTAQVLGWLLAEAAKANIISFDEFTKKVGPRRTTSMVTTSKRRRTMHAPTIDAEHLRRSHGRRPLGRHPTHLAMDRWVGQVAECVSTHCPFIAEKTHLAAPHAAELLPRLTALLPEASRKAGDAGTLLFALTPLLSTLPRGEARDWYEENHDHVQAAAACTEYAACPACVNDHPCPCDVTYELVTRRALDYGLTQKGVPVSLLADVAAKDLYEGARWRKIDTWPDKGMSDMAAHMVWIVAQQARAKGAQPTYTSILRIAVDRDLHKADPHLALEVAKHWSSTPERDADIAQLVTDVLADANTNPGYLELEVWFGGPYQRKVAARTPVARRPRLTNPKRPVADQEVRPPALHHVYRYQIHRRPSAAV